MRTGDQAGEALARATWRTLWRRREATAFVIGFTRLLWFTTLLVPLGVPTNSDQKLGAFIGAGVYLACVVPLINRTLRASFEPIAAWLRVGGTAPPGAKTALVRMARDAAVATVITWFGGGLLAAGVYASISSNMRLILTCFVGVAILGFHTAAFVYLQVERSLRQAFAMAFVDGVEGLDRAIGIKARFLLAWALGTGITLVGIGLVLLWDPHAPQVQIARAVAPLVVLGLVEGCTLIWWAAQSVTRPVDEVRAAMERVQRGQLAVEVTVDNGSEIGLLQAGFNDMVRGLRERARLAELLDGHVGREVAGQVLLAGPDFGGRQIEATVLFVDLINSTGLAEERSLPEVLHVLDAMFSSVVEVAEGAGGWVSKFVGDATMVVFGYPVETEDHASRGLEAAVALRERIVASAAGVGPLDVGIGISSGLLVAAHVGTSRRHEFTVIGNPANEAARLCELAKGHPGRILASGEVIGRAGVRAGSWVALGEHALRGRRRPLPVFEPVSVVAEARRILESSD